jgi:hypothetical protein
MPYTLTSVVYVEITGEQLVKRFFEWAIKNQIYSSVRGGGCGPEWMGFFYSPENAEKIEAWLKEQKES